MKSGRTPQRQKPSKVRQVQEKRRSNAAGVHIQKEVRWAPSQEDFDTDEVPELFSFLGQMDADENYQDC